jgi:polar amino acid transport system permease protein
LTGPGRGAAGSREVPWWLVAIGCLGLAFLIAILTSELHAQIFATVIRGLHITLFVTAVGFALAAAAGLGVAVCALSRHRLLREAARFLVEILRGIPFMVLLLYVAFVGAPALVAFANLVREPLGLEPWLTRDFSFLWRAIIALALAYCPFIAEVFRAGIQSVDRGQVEAAKSLGLDGWQRFRLVVLPQAIRIILPPLGNDFVAMLKDSSIVSVLGVADVTQLGKIYAAGSFRYLETYNVVAVIYLFLTISLSLVLRALERRLRASERGETRRPGRIS